VNTVIDWKDTHFINRFQGFVRYHWNDTCRTMQPNEIINCFFLFATVAVLLAILTYFQPMLMLISLILCTAIWLVGWGIMAGYDKITCWVAKECISARHAERVRVMEERIGLGPPDVVLRKLEENRSVSPAGVHNDDAAPVTPMSCPMAGVHDNDEEDK